MDMDVRCAMEEGGGYSRARFNGTLKVGNALAAILLAGYNIAYMVVLVRRVWVTTTESRYRKFARGFVDNMFLGKEKRKMFGSGRERIYWLGV